MVPEFNNSPVSSGHVSNHDLAAMIERLWHEKGHTQVRVTVKEKTIHCPAAHGKMAANVTMEVIVSNLVNALPPCSGCGGPCDRGEQRYCHVCHAEASRKHRAQRSADITRLRDDKPSITLDLAMLKNCLT